VRAVEGREWRFVEREVLHGSAGGDGIVVVLIVAVVVVVVVVIVIGR
jgi:hypothetical protein